MYISTAHLWAVSVFCTANHKSESLGFDASLGVMRTFWQHCLVSFYHILIERTLMPLKYAQKLKVKKKDLLSYLKNAFLFITVNSFSWPRIPSQNHSAELHNDIIIQCQWQNNILSVCSCLTSFFSKNILLTCNSKGWYVPHQM